MNISRSIQQFLAALTLAFATPAFAYAAAIQTDKTIVYSTSIQPIAGFAVPYTGRLQIKASKDGLLNGYYRPADNNDFIPVTGAIDGDHVWLDIGRTGDTRVNGTIANGKITGTLLAANGDVEKFTADDPRIQQ